MDYDTTISISDDEITDYVKDNFDIDDVFDEDEIKNYISRQFLPEDIFDEASLSIWAVDHGYTKE